MAEKKKRGGIFKTYETPQMDTITQGGQTIKKAEILHEQKKKKAKEAKDTTNATYKPTDTSVKGPNYSVNTQGGSTSTGPQATYKEGKVQHSDPYERISPYTSKETTTGGLNKPKDTSSSDKMSWAREAERKARKMMGGK